MRLRHTMRRVLPDLVCSLLSHSLLSHPLEGKLYLMTIPPTITVIEEDWSWLGLGLWFLTRLLSWVLSLLLLVSTRGSVVWKNKAHQFLEVVCLWRKH
jgi:hypothetical protein